ncbi:MAG: NeuD/PglB/VioB family sugar acetyltransferase [Thauera sp.]|nr:NeuD/PglB/VioB family sugar acetyltransferase [Thauera sp.]
MLLALAAAAGHRIVGVCDPRLAADRVQRWHGLPVLGDDAAAELESPGAVALINGIGQLPGGTARKQLFARLRARGFDFPAMVHPAAWVAPGVKLDEGAQIMAGAVIQPGSQIGVNSIVNTRAGIDHDCSIGANVHIAPGATLCGGVTIGDGAFIGAGAILTHGATVGRDAIVHAGAVLARDLPCGQILCGPASRTTTQRTT